MKQGVKFGLQMLGYYATLLLLCLLFLAFMGDTTFWLQAVLNLALLAGFAMLMLNAGGYRGEKASSLSATLEKRKAEGHAVDPVQAQEAFSKKTAGVAYLVAAMPFLLLAVVNLIYHPVFEAKLATLPPLPEVQVVEGNEEQDALLGELTDPAQADLSENDPGLQPVDITDPEEAVQYTSEYTNWVAFVTRIAFMPFVSLITLLQDNAQLLYILFVPLSLILPAFGVGGYLMGPSLREKKLKEIEKGTKKKKRNLRVNKKPREPKQPKHEV